LASFKDKVYSKARLIPKGKVATYKSLAKASGNPLAARAVGTIMHHNDYSHSKVPCHRVIKSNGEIGGFANGPSKKKKLLESEGIKIVRGKIDLSKYAFKF
jgi:O-6-methylguanine DNA methyltransferase